MMAESKSCGTCTNMLTFLSFVIRSRFRYGTDNDLITVGL
jgi:hypothetical protein